MTSQRRFRTILCLAGLFAVLATGIVLNESSRTPEVAGQNGKATKTAGDEAAIRAASKDYVLTMMKGDLAGVMAYWDEDADYIDETGKITRGKDKITALFKETLPHNKGRKADGKIHSVKFLRPEICLIDGTIEITGDDGVKESGRYAVVWNKVDGKWLISSVRDLPTEVTDLPSLAAAQLNGFEWLVGEWVQGGDKSGITINVRWDTNKAFVIMDYTIPREGPDPMRVTVRIGWDPLNNRIRSWLFDTDGGYGEGFWQKDGKRWIVGTSGVLPDGSTGGATHTLEFVDQDNFTWKLTDRDLDGQPLADAEIKLTRKLNKK